MGIWENEFSIAIAEDALYALTATVDPALVNVRQMPITCLPTQHACPPLMQKS